jgi:hypothetical protein
VESRENHHLAIGHPAPLRDAISLWALAFAVLAPPAAWLIQLAAGFACSSYLCFPNVPRVPELATAPGWLTPVLIALNLLGLLVAAGGIAVALPLLRRTAHEHADQPGSVEDAGEGRTRFLAVWAVVIGGLFLAAILFNTINLWLVPLCPA